MPDIESLVKDLGQNPQGAFAAHKELLKMVRAAGAPGKDSERADLAKALAAELVATNPPKKEKEAPQPKYSVLAKNKLIGLLAYVLTDAEIPVMMAALKDLDLRESARQALDWNPTPATTKALIEAAKDVGPRFRVTTIAALGRRGEPEAKAFLEEVAAKDTDEEVRPTAAKALGKSPIARAN